MSPREKPNAEDRHRRLYQQPELIQFLEALARPPIPPPMPPASLPVRLKTSARVRRCLPSSLVVARAVLRARRLWRISEQARADSHAALEPIVAGTPRAHEAWELARDSLIDQAANRAMYWQPWTPAEIEASPLERLRAAAASGMGVLLSYCHLGPFFHASSLGLPLGRPVFAVGGAWCFEPPSHDHWGRRVVRRWEGLCEHDGRLVPARGSFQVLRALLESGEIVLMHFDVPGSRRTQFLGKPVMMATGTARLALESGAVVLPIRMRRAHHRARADVHAPLRAQDFDGVEELHDALAAIHEQWILELPHTLEDPRRPGSWESGATALAWARPSFESAA